MRRNVASGQHFVHGKLSFLVLTSWDFCDCGGTPPPLGGGGVGVSICKRYVINDSAKAPLQKSKDRTKSIQKDAASLKIECY
jgi:hypothetical protein